MAHWRENGRGAPRQKRAGRRPEASGFITSTTPPPPLGRLIQTLISTDVAVEAAKYIDTARIEDCELVASYNWLDRAEPTILVPGKPPRWTPLPEPVRLTEDGGEYFRDPSSARYPKHPLEPAVAASLAAVPDLPARTDVVACVSTLGNLARFMRGEEREFRILVEKIGNTVFFTRRENSAAELLPNVRGYGHSFPQANTTWEPDVKESCSHMRILCYRFGGLSLLVRFQSSGYLAKPVSPEASRPPQAGNGDGHSPPTLDELADALAENTTSCKAPGAAADLAVKEAGCTIDQASVFELKTRALWKKSAEDTLAAFVPRLWICQIPTFILAYHVDGVFEDVQAHDVRDVVSKWERDHVRELSKLAALVHHIVAAVSARPDRKLEIRRQGIVPLELREQLPGAGDALSAAAKTLWTSKIPQAGTLARPPLGNGGDDVDDPCGPSASRRNNRERGAGAD